MFFAFYHHLSPAVGRCFIWISALSHLSFALPIATPRGRALFVIIYHSVARSICYLISSRRICRALSLPRRACLNYSRVSFSRCRCSGTALFTLFLNYYYYSLSADARAIHLLRSRPQSQRETCFVRRIILRLPSSSHLFRRRRVWQSIVDSTNIEYSQNIRYLPQFIILFLSCL